MRVAIIGAGMAGLACGQELAAGGAEVCLFDKGRGPGGRMSARRVTLGAQTLRFDHGAQYFTVRDPRFAAQVDEWQRDGIVARWAAAGEGAYVGTPAMNAPIKALAAQQDVTFAMRVAHIAGQPGDWTLVMDSGHEVDAFDALVVATPAEQAAPLLEEVAPHFSSIAADAISQPCWTMMLAFAARPDLPDTMRSDGALSWIACDSSKPGRLAPDCWVVQASADWTQEHLDEHGESVVRQLLAELAEMSGSALPRVRHASIHRWRYAMSAATGEGALWDASLQIGVCGDWLTAPRVEGAFVSGALLGDAMLTPAAGRATLLAHG